MQPGQMISVTPSFNSSSSHIADIAARVVEEFELEYESDGFFINLNPEEINKKLDDEEDKDSEFSFDTIQNALTNISADEMYSNGQIRPVYPVFGKDYSSVVKSPTRVRLPLRSLFMEERKKEASHSYSSSFSSEEDEDLKGVAPETYCVWTPKRSAAERKKNNSTGTTSSKRWRFKKFFSRSFSEGKDNSVSSYPSKRDEKVNQKGKVTSKVSASGGGGGGASPVTQNKSLAVPNSKKKK